jgi:uncharacterized protein YciI
VKYVLWYQSGDDVLEKAPLHFDAHRALIAEFAAAGTLLMTGPFADPREGAMSIFATREAAEDFAARDPFVANGVAKHWVIREWNAQQA